MEDRIIFLGTSGDIFALSRMNLGSGGIILQLGEVQLHIDPGPGTLKKAVDAKINLRGNTALLVSSADIKKSNDLNIVIDTMTYSGLDKQGVLIAPNSVINGDETSSPSLTRQHSNYLERILVFNKKSKAAIEDIEIYALPTKNKYDDTIGFKIIAPKTTITYTGDTSYFPGLSEHYKDSDIIIFNLQTNDKPELGQLSTKDVINIVKETKPKLIILTSFSMKLIKSDTLHEARLIQKETGIQTVAAKDGMSIACMGFTAKEKQKKLSISQPEKELKTEEQKPETIKVTEIQEEIDFKHSD
jgi:ribonuclease BN (tRNA processing enzyme)